jgi:UPF0489 domain
MVKLGMSNVLDLDLDFFVWPVVRGPVEGRPPADEVTHATAEQVRAFLEEQCGLSRDRKVLGRFCERHDEAFDAWNRWLSQGLLQKQFRVDHVDGHSDLSFGDASWSYVLETLLSLPVDQRATPERAHHRLNEGSYLTFAIANRWIEHLSYVYPVCPWTDYEPRRSEEFHGLPPDLNLYLFKDRNFHSGFIELLHLDDQGINRLMCGLPVTPISVEPSVPIEFIPANSFSSRGFTHIILAHSEEYCPEGADELIPVIREYFYED